MVNQSKDDEESSAACYVETYMDCVENLPNDLQRQLSRMLDLDSTCQKFVREFETHQRILSRGTDSTARKNALLRIQKVLIVMQDIGDEKLQIMQTIQDLIEKKARQLDIDYKNLKPKLEQENNEPLNVSNANSISSTSKNGTTSNSNGNSSITNNNNSGNTERQSRRGRRTTRTETSAEAVQSTSDSNVLSENQSSNLPSTSNGKRSASATNTNSRKNKKRNASQANQSREESPPKNDDSDENTDEPLYCTCNRVSFGKMIMCDNDSCSLEWFHFSCVNLTTKPKGKWYCPQCRGSRPNIMKSKTQLR